MTKRLTTIIVEDDFGRVQTKVETDLFPPKLMDIFLESIIINGDINETI